MARSVPSPAAALSKQKAPASCGRTDERRMETGFGIELRGALGRRHEGAMVMTRSPPFAFALGGVIRPMAGVRSACALCRSGSGTCFGSSREKAHRRDVRRGASGYHELDEVHPGH